MYVCVYRYIYIYMYTYQVNPIKLPLTDFGRNDETHWAPSSPMTMRLIIHIYICIFISIYING